MRTELIPYLLLCLSIVTVWFRPQWAMQIAFLAVGAALSFDRLSLIALPSIAALGLSLWWTTQTTNRLVRGLCYFIFLMLAVLMSNNLLPGFHNWPVFRDVHFSPDSAPFSMYLNFDKALVGVFILLYFTGWHVDARVLKVAGVTLAVLVVLMMPIALGIGYVRFDTKFPDGAWLWMLNNFFLVCFAEEGLFRGFIQGGLVKLRVPWPVALFIAAALFGSAHYKDGVPYMALAFVAGLFYGNAFHRTKQLSASIFVHFGLNLVHFLFFSYPSLQAGSK